MAVKAAAPAAGIFRGMRIGRNAFKRTPHKRRST